MKPFGAVTHCASLQFSKPQSLVHGDLTGRTVVITGANTGLGLQAALHFARMKPGRLILGCRNEVKGRAAVKHIEKETGFREAELWLIDLSKFSSVTDFADRFDNDGGRLDILVMNAGIGSMVYSATADNWESTLQVNHLSTCLLSLLLLPHLVKTGRDSVAARLVIVSSELHYFVNFSQMELKSPNLLELISTKEYCTTWKMIQRYPISKMLNIIFTRSLNERLSPSTHVVVNTVTSGLCATDLFRDLSSISALLWWISLKLFAHSAEEGSRQLVYAALAKPDDEGRLKGAFIWGNQVEEVSDYLVSPQGQSAQARVWAETIEILSQVSPKVKEVVEKYL